MIKTIEYSNGDKYVGEIEDGKKNDKNNRIQ